MSMRCVGRNAILVFVAAASDVFATAIDGVYVGGGGAAKDGAGEPPPRSLLPWIQARRSGSVTRSC